MNTAALSLSATSHIRLPHRDCPACGMPAPAIVALLPSGRRALIEACAICGRQDAIPINAREAYLLLTGNQRT